MTKLSTHSTFKLASKKAKSVAIKTKQLVTIKPSGAKYQVWSKA